MIKYVKATDLKLAMSFMQDRSDFFFNRLVLLFSCERKIFRLNSEVFPSDCTSLVSEEGRRFCEKDLHCS